MKRELAIEAIIYVLCILLVSLLWHRPIILFFCYLVISIGALSRWHRRSDVLFYSVAFLLGPTADAVAVYFGAWEYSKPIYLIPIWLPFLWGIAALLMKRISETILKTA
jgi:hypothetical protein